MDHRKLLLTRVLWADPYKTIYHFKAYRLQNSIIFFFYHNYHKDHNWGDRENYSCVFPMIHLYVLVFYCFGKQCLGSESAIIVLKKPYGWLLIEVYFKSYELFKFEWAIFIAGLHTLLHISKNVSKINIRPKGFFSSTFDTTLCQLNCVIHGDPFSSFDWLEKEKTQYLIYFHSLWRHNKAIEWSDFFLKCFIFRTIIKII